MLLMTTNNAFITNEHWLQQTFEHDNEQNTRLVTANPLGQVKGKEPPGEANTNGMRPLGPNFTHPGKYDVICARGGKARNHSGNLLFRELIQKHLDAYSKAASKIEKTSIVTRIIDSVRIQSPEGGFIKEIEGEYFEVGDHVAREVSFVVELVPKSSKVHVIQYLQKVGQCFRDLLHTKYKSSTKAKMAKRRMRGSSMDSKEVVTSPKKSRRTSPSIVAQPSIDGPLDTLSSEVYPIIDPIAISYDPSPLAAFAQINKQPISEDLGDRLLRTSILSLSDDNNWSNNTEDMEPLGMSEDEHMDWEYGPISFRRFEQKLQANGVADEQITASIFDLPVPEINAQNADMREPVRLVSNRNYQWSSRDAHHFTPGDNTVCLAFEQANLTGMDKRVCSSQNDNTVCSTLDVLNFNHR